MVQNQMMNYIPNMTVFPPVFTGIFPGFSGFLGFYSFFDGFSNHGCFLAKLTNILIRLTNRIFPVDQPDFPGFSVSQIGWDLPIHE